MNGEDAERVVSIPLDRAVELARLLESVVVSLDRIGSRIAGGDADAHTLDRFMTDWLVGPRLSAARMVLWEAVEETIGVERTAAIAESTPRYPDPVPAEVRALHEQRQRWNEEQLGHPGTT